MLRIGNVLYPEVFIGKYIRTHWDFEHDLQKILERSGHKSDFWGKYKQRLRFLDERRKNCIQKHDWFERLKGTGDLYAIKFKDEKNIRILFAFIEYENIEYVLLLYPFEEKDRRGKSRTSYGTGIPIALERLQEVLTDD